MRRRPGFELHKLPGDQWTEILNMYVDADDPEDTKGRIRRIGCLRLLAKAESVVFLRPLTVATLKQMLLARGEWRRSMSNIMFRLHNCYTESADLSIAMLFHVFMESNPNANMLPALKALAMQHKKTQDHATEFGNRIPHIPQEHLPMLHAVLGNLNAHLNTA